MSKPFLVIIKLGCFPDISWFDKEILGGKFFVGKKKFGQRNLCQTIFWVKKIVLEKKFGQHFFCQHFFGQNKFLSEIFLGQKKVWSEIS